VPLLQHCCVGWSAASSVLTQSTWCRLLAWQVCALQRHSQPLSSSYSKHSVKGSPSLESCCDEGLHISRSPALQPKLPIEERLRAQGLPEAEIARRKKISDSARGRVPWNKGKKHSAGARRSLRSPACSRAEQAHGVVAFKQRTP
jgi:NUMOD3 motif